MIEAVFFSREMILYGLDQVDLGKQYFRIEQDAYHQPGVFEYRIFTNEKEYLYQIQLTLEKRYNKIVLEISEQALVKGR
ncbi:MAG: hypothetical protein HFH41_11065 [Lachnospiraceae bacterium]|nr:hypothetical protein [Lachnospiraceae bacterium]